MQPRFIVGLDPSLSCTGICIYNVRTKKVTVLSVKTKKDNFLNPEARAQHIANTIFAKVQEYCRPDDSHIGVERLISHRTTRSQSQLQALFGMLWYVFSQNNYPVYAVAPSEVKKSFTGKGNADKLEVRAQCEVTTEVSNTDESDAVAVCNWLCDEIGTARFNDYRSEP